ncbi:MAG: AzlC family ABC transporter permease [Clostridia bacterium]|nr:AzlC family ABC transporter permease [Clostridia bacterium]MCR4905555.1 AzlC family ABC transporter permease [Clostridiales bacterium]
MTRNFFRGILHGVPIALGYLSVSFGFGILAVRAGLAVWQATLISAVCVTSAGQVAGVEIIAAAGGLAELALVQLTINLRYALMSLSLSQKTAPSFTLPKRLAASFGITDEIFAVCSAEPVPLTFSYMAGVILISAAGWIAGTALGAAAGEILPERISAALGIVLYGMFIAIVVPTAKKRRGVLFAAVSAAVLSVLSRLLIPALSGGFSVILCTLIASCAAALLFPIGGEDA